MHRENLSLTLNCPERDKKPPAVVNEKVIDCAKTKVLILSLLLICCCFSVNLSSSSGLYGSLVFSVGGLRIFFRYGILRSSNLETGQKSLNTNIPVW